MKMNLVNSKPNITPSNALSGNAGIGIINVRKRLSLLYPDNHILEITNDEEVFIVNLRIGLERKALLPERPFKKTAAELYA
jgi:LytS/YehU family sensor histidine kinase